jgi:hypothetical protein
VPVAGHIAHLNWGVLSADWDDPAVAPFADNVDRVNRIAQRSSGFVWQLPDAEMAAAEDIMASFGPVERLAANLTVWRSLGDFMRFVYDSLHGRFLARRSEWFLASEGPAHVIWPVAEGHRPTLAEARERADRLLAEGPGPSAFDLAWARAETA